MIRCTHPPNLPKKDSQPSFSSYTLITVFPSPELLTREAAATFLVSSVNVPFGGSGGGFPDVSFPGGETRICFSCQRAALDLGKGTRSLLPVSGFLRVPIGRGKRVPVTGRASLQWLGWRREG